MALRWKERPAPTRGAKPGLSAERIARAAIALADVDGLDAVSMSRVASDLGVTPMALYGHVLGKMDSSRTVRSAMRRTRPRWRRGRGRVSRW